MNSSRQLVAIMFTEIPGYHTLIQRDPGLYKTCKAVHHDLIHQITKKYGGRMVQYYSGTTLTIFQSAIEAVKCGVDLQSEFHSKIPVKIGVHSGDVIVNEDGVIGDSVNLTSRIESLAVAGSVLISDKVYDEISNQRVIQSQFLGKFDMKNVDQPIGVYAITNEPLVVPAADSLQLISLHEKQSRRSRVRWYASAFTSLILLILLITNTGLLKKLVNPMPQVERTIAVLPFTNLSQDPEQEYFSDGITEDIITHLSKVEDIRVISRTSIMGYKETEKSIREIADQLKVAHILEGSVRKNKNQVRISAKLIDTNTEEYLWTDTYDRKWEDIFQIQSEVSTKVAKALNAQLSPKETFAINEKITSSVQAYELYLEGMYHLRSGSIDGLNRSYPLLRQAIKLDPEFAQAYSGIANYFINQGAWRGDLTPRLARNEALPYALKALQLDPNLKDAHNQLGTIRWWYEWNFAEAEKEYQRGITPNNQGFYYGFFLLMTRRFHSANALFEDSYRLNPLDPHNRSHRGMVQFFLNNETEAIRILEEAVELFPAALTVYHKLGKVYLNTNRYDEAISILQRSHKLDGHMIPSMLGDLAIAYFKKGERSKTDEIINELKHIASKSSQGSPSFFLGQIFAGIGQLELAFEWLEKSFNNNEVEMIWLGVEPQFDPIRDDPRFTKLLDQIGFPQYVNL